MVRSRRRTTVKVQSVDYFEFVPGSARLKIAYTGNTVFIPWVRHAFEIINLAGIIKVAAIEVADIRRYVQRQPVKVKVRVK